MSRTKPLQPSEVADTASAYDFTRQQLMAAPNGRKRLVILRRCLGCGYESWVLVQTVRSRKTLGVCRKCKLLGRTGERHHCWSGGIGKVTSKDGYVDVSFHEEAADALVKAMAYHDRRGRWVVREHRLVVARALGRPLLPTEQVHHIDGDRANNAIENLQLRQRAHGVGVVLVCNACGSSDVGAVGLHEEAA